MRRSARAGFALAISLALPAITPACAGAPPSPGIAPPSTSPAPGTAALAPAPTTEPDGAPKIEDSPPPNAPARYVAPLGCPLAYDYRVAYRMEMTALGFGSGFEMLGQLEARADAAPSRSALKFVWTRMDVISPTGTVKGVRADEKLAVVQITTDGVRWKQVDEKAPAGQVVQANLGYPGLVNLWPTLPTEARPGSQASWAVPPQTFGGMAMAFAGLRQNTPKVENIPVELKKWVRIGGELACVLEGSWEKEQRTEEKVSAQKVIKRTSIRGAARFVVLASGRLLTSEIRQATDNLQTQQGERLATEGEVPGNDSHEDLSSELRLVGACKGVTMPPLHPPAAPDERAMMLHARLRDLASHGDRAAIGALLAPALSTKTDKNALIDAVLGYVKRFGDNALGMPARPAAGALRVEPNRIHFDLVGIVARFPSSQESAVVTVTIDVDQKGDQYWIRSIKAVTQGAAPKDVFELSDARIFIAEQPPPSKTAPATAPKLRLDSPF